jgi:hypothetical protein
MYVCYLLMYICLCLWFLMFAYATYVCLCLFIYLLMGYDISEGIFHWTTKKGKCLVEFRRGGSMYIRGLVLPLFCLSFFLLHATFCILF